MDTNFVRTNKWIMIYFLHIFKRFNETAKEYALALFQITLLEAFTATNLFGILLNMNPMILLPSQLGQ